MEICKIFTFDSAHQLPWHDGKCRNLHGHTYKLEVYLKGKLNDNGILLDFGDLKIVVNRDIVEKLDHKMLNEIYENPTAEIMAKRIFITLNNHFITYPNEVRVSKIILWETPTSKVIYRGEDD